MAKNPTTSIFDIEQSIYLNDLKGDVSDFIQTFQNKEEATERLSTLIEHAESYELPKKATIEDSILDIATFCNLKIEKRREYLSPWIKQGSMHFSQRWFRNNIYIQ